MATPWRKACTACAKSKRQCTKQVPSCRRCTDRGLDCVYVAPQRKPAAGGESPATAASDVMSSAVRLSDDHAFDCAPLGLAPDSLDTGALETQLASAAPTGPSQSLVLRDLWFLEPLSWEIEHPTPQTQDDVDEAQLHKYVSTVISWLRQWVTEDHNPLIHSELYRGRMPRWIQDAFTAVAAYFHKTPRTESTVLYVVDQRAEQLLQDQCLQEHLGFPALDTPGHLARVHALLAYQVLRLFDGDIRARARADASLPTLFLWCDQMRQGALSAIRAGTLAALAVEDSGLRSEEAYASWKMWILAESVRRAYLTAKIVQQVYLTLKRGWSDCPGGMHVTLRAGLWEAKSAYAWSKCVREKGPLFMQSHDVERAFVETCPEHVDDFGHAVISISSGPDRSERWLGEKKGQDKVKS